MRKFTAHPGNYIAASSNPGSITLSKSELTQQFTDVFNKAMGGDYDETSNPADNYFLRIDINQDGDGVMVDIEAETYFDNSETPISYSEYKSIMEEIGETNIQSKAEFYQSMHERETLVEKMDKVIKAYNPDWYFELYNACRSQAYLDNAVLEA